MCFPVCRGAAYFSTSVFIYRSLLIIISMISSSLTRLKSTYLAISLMEELLLQLIYFIPLFTSSTFIFIGLQSYSFTFVLNGTVCLGLTLFIRYAMELGYIHLIGWTSFSRKLPEMTLNIVLDFTLVLVLLLYARNRLRKRKKGLKEEDTKKEEEFSDGSTEVGEPQVIKGHKEGPSKYSHTGRSFSPGPFVLPPDELDDISIPPSAPIAILRTSKL